MRPLSRQIAIFLALTFGLSCIPYTLVLRAHQLGAYGGLAVLSLMWCPALAALATCAVCRIRLSNLGWRIGSVKSLAYGYFLPILYAAPVYLVCWIAIQGSYVPAGAQIHKGPFAGSFAWSVVVLSTVGVLLSLISALGDEIGWRGFLLPRLTQRFGFTVGCLVSGSIWAVWHYPALLFADYNAGTNPFYALACFTLMVIAIAFVLGWLRLRSSSLWPCALLHASHNLFVQEIFDRLTVSAGRARYITTEFGCGMVLTIGACALWFWLRRKALPAQEGVLPGPEAVAATD